MERVELHCHTNMSQMDGIGSAEEIIKAAIDMGQSAIAITDHGTIQDSSEIKAVLEKCRESNPQFKVIYGMEAYMVDDTIPLVENEKGQPLNTTYVVLDLETTGLSVDKHEIVKLQAIKIENFEMCDTFSTLIKVKKHIPEHVAELIEITDEMLVNEKIIEEVIPEFMEFVGNAVLVAHNLSFETKFLINAVEQQGYTFNYTMIDTVNIARLLLEIKRYRLDIVASALDVSRKDIEGADYYVKLTAKVWIKLIQMLKEKGVNDLKDINSSLDGWTEYVKRLPCYHTTLLVQSEEGRKNLDELVKLSRARYFHNMPRIPKSELMKHRTGLLVGSACEAGEVFQEILGGNRKKYKSVIKFYDFLEVQPAEINAWMVDSSHYVVNSLEAINEINGRIVMLGELYEKIVVATGDVHFIHPEDSRCRAAMMKEQGFENYDRQMPLYLRSTEDMLKQFAFLGEDKAKEIVVTNTNKIAELCEYIKPIPKCQYFPKVENAAQKLYELCYANVHKEYGDEIPEFVEKRLESELEMLKRSETDFIYWIAAEEVWAAKKAGTLVGNRGAAGASLAAYFAGITETNPLPAHYLCPRCHWVAGGGMKKGKIALDMAEMNCPKCGAPMKKRGYDIPYETFLGIKGYIWPDFDLNFAIKGKEAAIERLQNLFGKENIYGCGMIGYLSETSALRIAQEYLKEDGEWLEEKVIEDIAEHIAGIKMTTGEREGSIIIFPKDKDISEVTALQYPADDSENEKFMTHFEYHVLDNVVLRMELLLHNDLELLYLIQKYTEISPAMVNVSDEKVLSLFQCTESLGIKPEDISGVEFGTLGLQEFDSEFVMDMLKVIKPHTVQELIAIDALSHGVGTWLGNGEELIENGSIKVSDMVSNREDVMNYLIEKGMEKELAYAIMESVRRGKRLTESMCEEMKRCNVPDWYIDSCKKIIYLFPKGHAANYVLMQLRLAYFKVYYPLAFYAAYFSIKEKYMNCDIACQKKKATDKWLMLFKNGRLSKERSEAVKEKYENMRLL